MELSRGGVLFVAIAPRSLLPRLWPKFTVDDMVEPEEMVLDRLEAAELEKTDDADELVDVVEPCLSGLGIDLPESVCARFNDALDITESAVQVEMRQATGRTLSLPGRITASA